VGLFLVGCAGATVSPAPSPGAIALPDPLRFTVTDAIGLEALEASYSELRDVLAETLGTSVEFVPVNDQVSGAVLIKGGEVDVALVGPSEYVVIRSRTNAEPVLAITRPNYRSVLATQAAQPLASVADFKGKTIALSDVGSTSGHLGPVKMLIDAGLDPQSMVTVEMLGDAGSIAALQKGEVAAWGGSLTDYEAMSADNPEAFVILAEGPPLPSDVFVASSSVPASVVAEIQARLLANAAQVTTAIATHERKYQGSTLQAAQDADYDPIREVYRAIGQGNFIE
jgi:phosphonate transport system substrate-binding protein